MDSLQYRFVRDAQRDLKAIWRYTFRTWGERQAEKYTGGIKSCCETLAAHPARGKLLPGIGESIRSYRYEHHYIFYLEQEQEIVILAILHERMDLVRQLQTRISGLE